MDAKSFYQKQISLSEWFENSDYKFTKKFKKEDNEKRERLRVLNEIINLPFEIPKQFEAKDISNNKEKFKDFYSKHKNELCALRLMPHNSVLPKLRLRGTTLEEAVKWFNEQTIDPKKYKADIIPHSENELMSTIFVVNQKGFYGEIIPGKHNQLTQGFYRNGQAMLFSYNFDKITLSKNNNEAVAVIKKIISHLKVSDAKIRKLLSKKLRASFASNFLKGYFETIKTKEYGLWFIDYNRLLGKYYSNFTLSPTETKNHVSDNKTIKGIAACKGRVTGKVKIIDPKNRKISDFRENEVLVCEMTTPDQVLLIKKASAIVTDKGGVLCHAAIVAREFGIPCIVATNNATSLLKNGDLVEVDANNGIVRILS